MRLSLAARGRAEMTRKYAFESFSLSMEMVVLAARRCPGSRHIKKDQGRSVSCVRNALILF